MDFIQSSCSPSSLTTFYWQVSSLQSNLNDSLQFGKCVCSHRHRPSVIYGTRGARNLKMESNYHIKYPKSIIKYRKEPKSTCDVLRIFCTVFRNRNEGNLSITKNEFFYIILEMQIRASKVIVHVIIGPDLNFWYYVTKFTVR